MANELTSGEARLRRALTAHVTVPNYAAGKPGVLRVEHDKYRLVANETIQQYVQNLGMSLVPQFQRLTPDDDSQKISFHFYVIEHPEPNASAYPNGVVVVHSGLLSMVENEAELAAVLSHEIAHAVQEHTYRQLQYHKNLRMAILIGGAVGSMYGGQGVSD